MSDRRVSFAAEGDFDTAVTEAITTLRREGVVVLDRLVDPTAVGRCRDEVDAQLPDIARRNRERNYGPCEGRHCAPV